MVELLQEATPRFEPLDKVIHSRNLQSQWLWTGAVVQDTVRIDIYRHQQTRTYLNIDANGKCYQYVVESEERFEPVPCPECNDPTAQPKIRPRKK